MLTGEAQPVVKEIGSQVYGGSTLLQGSLVVRVTKTSENATFNQIMRMVESAQSTKAPIQGFADKVASVFVPVIVSLALLTWVAWFSTSHEDQSYVDNGGSPFALAFNYAISTLVIACPCALGLATPTAVMVGTGLAATYGILVKSAEVLERMR
jgi:Cu+-exporting ATPase